TTTRTVAISHQLSFMQNGFIPLGIFPNARKVDDYETFTLMGAFRKGVLEKQAKVERVPMALMPILKVVHDSIPGWRLPAGVDDVSGVVTSRKHFDEGEVGSSYKGMGSSKGSFSEEFEFIEAAHFVEKRFYAVFADDMDSTFYPFHRPNLLIYGKRSKIEIYAAYNKQDHYCVIIVASQVMITLKENFKKLILDMKRHGISYVEILVRMSRFERLAFYMDNEFIPSAIYPAMREIEGEMHDYVLLTRTMEPLDFRGINIHHAFRPFISQYTSQWIQRHINSFEVYYGRENEI
ncbi:MAG: hypothetical protein HQK50_12725, partial [Oligoflexia bacterium]|nr:hypothetical protein [Oligoflexia bacterium]